MIPPSLRRLPLPWGLTVMAPILALTIGGLDVALAANDEPQPPGRMIPGGCLRLGLETGSTSEQEANRDETRWNRLYLQGVEAINDQALDLARASFCGALAAARGFGPRDWRFAETLDELGLVEFLSGDLEAAEQMQGAAVAEMLLALGPTDAVTTSAPGRESRRSSVAIYADRLRLIYRNQGRSERLPDPVQEPRRFLTLGYLPLDSALVRRLDWLISQYLLAESFDAAKRLEELRAGIASETER